MRLPPPLRLVLSLASLALVAAACGSPAIAVPSVSTAPAVSVAPPSSATPAPTPTPTLAPTPIPTPIPLVTPVPTQPVHTDLVVRDTRVIAGGGDTFAPPPTGFVFLALDVRLARGLDFNRADPFFTVTTTENGWSRAPQAAMTPDFGPVADGPLFLEEGWVTFLVPVEYSHGALEVIFGPLSSTKLTTTIDWSKAPVTP